VEPEVGDVGGKEYWHVKRYGSIIREERSSAGPRSLVDRGGARTRGVWSPRPGQGSIAVPKLCLSEDG
jgi:hypothetical protein